MATMNITVNEDFASGVVFTITNEQSNSCKTIFTCTATTFNDIGDTFHVSVTDAVGGYVLTCNDPNYIYNVNYTSTLKNVWTVELENSGIMGTYRTMTLVVSNITKSPAVTFEIMTRYNDGAIC